MTIKVEGPKDGWFNKDDDSVEVAVEVPEEVEEEVPIKVFNERHMGSRKARHP